MKIKRFFESHDQNISDLEDIFADVSEDVKVDIRALDEHHPLPMLWLKLIGPDLFYKAFEVKHSLGFIFGEVLQNAYAVTLWGKILDTSQISDIEKRCKMYGDLDLLYDLKDPKSGEHSFCFVKNKKEMSEKATRRVINYLKNFPS